MSLTINAVDDRDDGCDFAINVIPHTGSVTTLGGLVAGDRVNLEIDTIARYVERMLAADRASFPRTVPASASLRAAETEAG